LLGQALAQNGSDAEAIKVLEEAARLDSSAAEPRVLLGKLLAKRGQTLAATRYFEEALKLDPNDRTAAYQLAIVYRKAGKMKEAQALMSKVGQETSVPEANTVHSRELVRIVREASK
jgi:Flp pilus assembly protein TadD